MLRRLLPLAVLAVGLAVAPAHGAVGHHNPIGMPDPTGDANGAPDILRVTVANNVPGVILFVVQVTNRDGFVANDLVVVAIDSDRDAATGRPDRGRGIDFEIRLDVDEQTVTLHRWSGSGFGRLETTTLHGEFNGGYVVRINRSELGSTSAFDFYVGTASVGGGSPRTDLAPDGGSYAYRLSTSHVEAMTPRWTPTAPRAGASFRLRALRLTLQTGDSVPAARIRCQARLAGLRLRGTGRGTCTFRLPRTARGKRLVLFVTAAPADGEAETGQQTFRVR